MSGKDVGGANQIPGILVHLINGCTGGLEIDRSEAYQASPPLCVRCRFRRNPQENALLHRPPSLLTPIVHDNVYRL